MHYNKVVLVWFPCTMFILIVKYLLSKRVDIYFDGEDFFYLEQLQPVQRDFVFGSNSTGKSQEDQVDNDINLLFYTNPIHNLRKDVVLLGRRSDRRAQGVVVIVRKFDLVTGIFWIKDFLSLIVGNSLIQSKKKKRLDN